MAKGKCAKKKPEDENPSVATDVVDEAQESTPTEEAVDSKETEPTELEKMASEIEELKKQIADISDAKLRLQADFENHRQRNAQLRQTSLNDGKCMVVLELLKSLDNFERAISVECSDKGYASGMQMIYKMMCDSLNSLGLEEITEVEVFDPKIHEAVMSEEVEGAESGKIIAVLQKGYRFNGKVIRPAMVKVAK